MKIMKEKVDTKICGVCGDKALGYNFNAVSCESCKAFFRRNAVIEKEFKCPFSNQCSISTVTRRFCQKCRLDKCFAIGMCKDLIMTEQDKAAKRQKIEENRAKKRSVSSFKSGFKKIKKEALEADFPDGELFASYTDSDSIDTNLSDGYQPNNPNLMGHTPPIDTPNCVRPEDVEEPSSNISASLDSGVNSSVVSSSSNIDLNYEKVSEVLIMQGDNCLFKQLINNNSCSNNNQADGGDGYKMSSIQATSRQMLEITKDVVNEAQRVNPTESTSIESILCEAIKLEYETYAAITRSQSRELNDAERGKLSELIAAHKELLTPLNDDLRAADMGENFKYQTKVDNDPGLVDVVNLTAIGIRRLIKMAKKIGAFRNMCQEDQVALLKGGCTEIMILQSAMRFDHNKQNWRLPHAQSPLTVNADVLKQAKGNIYEAHNRFIKTFDPKWMADEKIIVILCAIVLFTPDRPKVIHDDVIKLEQNSYYYLLRRYLESIYVGCEAKSKFLKLIQKIAEIKKLNEEVVNVYLNVNPSQVEPLLIEMFDLNK